MGFCYVYDEDGQVLKGVEYPRPSDIRSSNGKWLGDACMEMRPISHMIVVVNQYLSISNEMFDSVLPKIPPE